LIYQSLNQHAANRQPPSAAQPSLSKLTRKLLLSYNVEQSAIRHSAKAC